MRGRIAKGLRWLADRVDAPGKERTLGLSLKPAEIRMPDPRPDPIAPLPGATGDTGWRGGWLSTGGGQYL